MYNFNFPSIGVLLTSRNNYDFMEKYWIPRTIEFCDIGNIKILNIDEDSTEEEKNKGKKLCKKYNIYFMDRENRGMLNNLDTATRFFSPEIKYIVWFQHDSWPLQKDFFRLFDEIVFSGKLDEFGVVGFNAIAQNIFKGEGEYEDVIKKFNDGEKPIAVLARGFVGQGDHYYCGCKSTKIKTLINSNLFSNPFAIESPAWYSSSVNVKKFKENIDLSHKFYFHKSWDDIAFQFLNKNIYNIAIPSLYIDHRPDLKENLGLPVTSVRLVKKGDDTFHSLVGFNPNEWIGQWGFDFEKRATFENIKEKYKGTLIYDFYNHDYRKGPLRTFKGII